MARSAPKKAESMDPPFTWVDLMTGKKPPRKNFYLLSGSDPYIFSRIIDSLREIYLSDDPSGFNYLRFSAEHTTKASVILNACEEYPFGSVYKMIVVDNVQKMSASEGEKIKRYLDNPSATSILVLVHYEDEMRSSGAGKFSPSRTLKSALSERGLHIACKLAPQEVRKWLVLQLDKEGKKWAAGAADILISTVGSDLWELHNEIQKLILYAGKRGIIKEEDIRTLTSVRPQAKIFNLNEEVGSKRTGRALMILDELLREKVVGPQILATLQNHFSFLFRIRKLIDSGESYDSISKILHKHPFYIKKSASQALNFNYESYDGIFDLIARADGGMKSGFDDRWVLELTIIQICRMRA